MLMAYRLSILSLQRLDQVKPNLVMVIEKAINLSSVDFGVLQGLRTLEEQRENVRKGASQTMNSKHLTGDAVDLVAYAGGKISWDDSLYCFIAEAVRDASVQLGVKIRWGGCWGILEEGKSPLKQAKEYGAKRRAEGKKPFFDWGHFELA